MTVFSQSNMDSRIRTQNHTSFSIRLISAIDNENILHYCTLILYATGDQ